MKYQIKREQLIVFVDTSGIPIKDIYMPIDGKIVKWCAVTGEVLTVADTTVRIVK